MISLKSKKDIGYLRKAGHILASALEEIAKHIKPGVTTLELDSIGGEYIVSRGAEPSFKGYKHFQDVTPYPSAICASVNDEVVHAPASKKTLKTGDIVGLDIGLKYHVHGREYFVDMAKTFGVGKITPAAQELIAVTKKALEIGIAIVKPGNTISDIGKEVQQYVESRGFSVVRALVGHGVGFAIHEEPQIPNYYTSGMPSLVIKKGMVLAIEPMVNAGSYEVETLDDEWTIVTADGTLSAHFEHTVAVTDNGCEILTI